MTFSIGSFGAGPQITWPPAKNNLFLDTILETSGLELKKLVAENLFFG